MGDRATLEKIYAIMRRLLLVKMDGLNPIPRKGTTRHECYRALYEIQELLETRRYLGKHLPQSKADRIRAMTDEELDKFLGEVQWDVANYCGGVTQKQEYPVPEQRGAWLDWLKQEANDAT